MLLVLAPALPGAAVFFVTRGLPGFAIGLLGLAGGSCMLAGALMLNIHLATALATTIPFSVILTVLFSIAIRARRNKSATNTGAAIS